MARAKRTDRTEARRRYRSEQLAQEAAEETGEGSPEPAPRVAAAPPAARPGITTAFRASFRPLDVRSDLRALPSLVRHWSLFVPVGVAIAAAALFVASGNELGATVDTAQAQPLAGQAVSPTLNVSYLLLQLFLYPPPIAGAFFVGFTAPRASWLSGLIQGIVAALAFGFVLLTPAGRLLVGTSDPGPFILQALLIGPIGGSLFASAAAWYRRFLNLANPNRGRSGASSRGQGRSSGRAKPRQVASATRRR